MIITRRYIIVLLFIATASIADNGDRLAYLQYDGDYWQVFINDENGNRKQITKSKYDKSAISWLANGSKIFACGIQADAEIVDIKTGVVEIVGLPKSTINDAVISPDGTIILYSYIAAGSTDNKLWLYDIRSKKDKPILASMPGRQYDPKWSVMGDAFYFTTGFANKRYSIAKMVSGAKKAEIVVQNAALNLDVDVAKSGDLAYSSNIKNNFDIWIKQGRGVKQLTNTHETESHPSWASKSDAIYYASIIKGISNIWCLNIKGNTQAQQVTDSKMGARYPVVFKAGER